MADLVQRAAQTGTTQRKVRVATPPVTVRVYPLVGDAVERGITFGIRRVFKYAEAPLTEEGLLARQELIQRAVMDELCELLDFGDPA